VFSISQTEGGGNMALVVLQSLENGCGYQGMIGIKQLDSIKVEDITELRKAIEQYTGQLPDNIWTVIIYLQDQ